MEFSRPEYWSGQLCPSPGDLPNPATEPRSPTLQADSFFHVILFYLFIYFEFLFFKFYLFIYLFLNFFIFKLYNIVLVLPNIEMNPPQVYMCSPSWTLPVEPRGKPLTLLPGLLRALKVKILILNIFHGNISYSIVFI